VRLLLMILDTTEREASLPIGLTPDLRRVCQGPSRTPRSNTEVSTSGDPRVCAKEADSGRLRPHPPSLVMKGSLTRVRASASLCRPLGAGPVTVKPPFKPRVKLAARHPGRLSGLAFWSQLASRFEGSGEQTRCSIHWATEAPRSVSPAIRGTRAPPSQLPPHRGQKRGLEAHQTVRRPLKCPSSGKVFRTKRRPGRAEPKPRGQGQSAGKRKTDRIVSSKILKSSQSDQFSM
jgi:hypothetical protein